MTSLFPVLILLALGFLLWMRDEMKHAPTKKDKSFPLPKPEDGSRVSEEVNESCGISLPPGISLPDKDYNTREGEPNPFRVGVKANPLAGRRKI